MVIYPTPFCHSDMDLDSFQNLNKQDRGNVKINSHLVTVLFIYRRM